MERDDSVMESKSNMDQDLLGMGVDDPNDDYCETYFDESGSPEEIAFDEAIGALEEILMDDDEFTEIQRQFFEQYCDKFTDNEENRVEYTAIFEDYTTLMEHTLERKLCERISDFDMSRFESQVIARKDQIGGDVLDMILSFSDFPEFKSLMIAHKQMRDGTAPQFGDLLVVSNYSKDQDANEMNVAP